jgi:hypothetical protein
VQTLTSATPGAFVWALTAVAPVAAATQADQSEVIGRSVLRAVLQRQKTLTTIVDGIVAPVLSRVAVIFVLN